MQVFWDKSQTGNVSFGGIRHKNTEIFLTKGDVKKGIQFYLLLIIFRSIQLIECVC